MTAPSLLSLHPGDLLAGKYRVERVLGEGAMGIVVAARHVDLDEVRAIKLMLPSAIGDGGVDRFLREARAAVRLKSPHVCRVIDVGRLDDGSPYIVMEHLEGADLKHLLETRGKLPPPEVVGYILQACEALAEAHALGIVHRDLKPANLFLTRGANGLPCVKILDFGIAKVARPEGGLELTRPAEAIGTPVFMSPEQMRGMRDVDARADVWALGVTLYRALTGRLPFAGTSLTEVCAAVVADSPAPPSSTGIVLPPGLEAILLRCMEKSPDNRFASVTELATALLPYAEVPITSSGAWPTVIQSQSASLVPELSLLPAPSAGGTTTGLAAFSAKPNPAPTAKPEPSWRSPVFGGIAVGVGAVLIALLVLHWLSPAASSPHAASSASAAPTPVLPAIALDPVEPAAVSASPPPSASAAASSAPALSASASVAPSTPTPVKAALPAAGGSKPAPRPPRDPYGDGRK